MERPKIIRLWGKADDLEIEFKNEGGIWKVDVPPDLTDGVYAVVLHALNELYESTTWVGELFMSNGACCIKINYAPYQVWFCLKQYTMDFSSNHNMEIKENNLYSINILEPNFELIIRKRCNHAC